MLRVWCGAALVLTALFATANMALSREWEAGKMDDEWQVVFTLRLFNGELVGSIMNLDGTRLNDLVLNGQWIVPWDCSPNGSSFGFVSQGVVYVAAANGNDLQRVAINTQDASNLSISNDGGSVIFNGSIVDQGYGIYRATVENSQLVDLSDQLPSNGSEYTIAYDVSPDGRYVVFTMTGFQTLHLDNADGEVIAEFPGLVRNPEWSPDGNMIAFSANWDGNFEIYLLDVKHFIIMQVTHETEGFGNLHPSWTPDGQQIVYVHHLEPAVGGDVYVMRSDGHAQQKILAFGDPFVTLCILTARPESLVSDS